MKIIELPAIKQALDGADLMPAIEAGFVAYSDGRCTIPPVGELLLPKGEAHIKYGCIEGEPYYVVKIASGFAGNPALGLPSGLGMMLVFSQETGAPVAILLDEGYLTDLRTALAGAIAARYLAPDRVKCIGILGTGIQARMQLQYLAPVTRCRDVLVLGRSAEKVAAFIRDAAALGFEAAAAKDAGEIGEACRLIVTTTPATEPLLHAAQIRPGTHINAIGSDTPAKQELAAQILARADLMVADSIEQCRLRGEISQALRAGLVEAGDLIELGDIIAGRAPGRTDEGQVTIFDSTGVAVQDIQISKLVVERAAE